MGRLDGKVIFITGGARGLGAKMCSRFVEEGAKGLMIGDLKEKELNETVDTLRKNFKVEVLPITMDVSKEEDWMQATEQISDKFGSLDTLINNAGITFRHNFLDSTVEGWNEAIAVNQTGVFLGIKHCAPLMKESGKGSIINLSSIAGLTGYFASAYTASKWAVRGMTKAAAMELGGWGIRVNSIHPGFIWSPLTVPAKEMVERFNEVNALNRAGKDIEIADGAVYLASDESSYMTGSELVIDGGLTAGGGVRKVAKDMGFYDN